MNIKKKVAVLLHDIRSSHNVGSMFRTAESAGVQIVYLSGYSPLPVDKFGRAQKDIAKVSLGAEKTLAWQYESDPVTIIKKLKKQKYQVIGLEQANNSIDYKKVKLENNVLFVVGNEVSGISSELLSLCDVVVEIPMKGKKESLNVSVAFGIGLFRMLGI